MLSTDLFDVDSDNLAIFAISICVSKLSLLLLLIMFVANLNALIKLYALCAIFISLQNLLEFSMSSIVLRLKQC